MSVALTKRHAGSNLGTAEKRRKEKLPVIAAASGGNGKAAEPPQRQGRAGRRRKNPDAARRFWQIQDRLSLIRLQLLIGFILGFGVATIYDVQYTAEIFMGASAWVCATLGVTAYVASRSLFDWAARIEQVLRQVRNANDPYQNGRDGIDFLAQEKAILTLPALSKNVVGTLRLIRFAMRVALISGFLAIAEACYRYLGVGDHSLIGGVKVIAGFSMIVVAISSFRMINDGLDAAKRVAAVEGVLRAIHESWHSYWSTEEQRARAFLQGFRNFRFDA